MRATTRGAELHAARARRGTVAVVSARTLDTQEEHTIMKACVIGLGAIGGFIAHAMGHVPRRGEHFEINKLRFEVLHTRGGAVKWFKVYPTPADRAPQ